MHHISKTQILEMHRCSWWFWYLPRFHLILKLKIDDRVGENCIENVFQSKANTRDNKADDYTYFLMIFSIHCLFKLFA